MSTHIDTLTATLIEQKNDLDNVIATLTAESDRIGAALSELVVNDEPVATTAPAKRTRSVSNGHRRAGTCAAQIRAALSDGEKPSAIADRLECSVQYVYNVRRSS